MRVTEPILRNTTLSLSAMSFHFLFPPHFSSKSGRPRTQGCGLSPVTEVVPVSSRILNSSSDPLFYDHESAANRVGELLEIWKEDSVQKEQASLDIIMAYIPFSAL